MEVDSPIRDHSGARTTPSRRPREEVPYGERPLGSASKRSRKEALPAFPPSDHATMAIATSSGADLLTPGQEQIQLELARLQKERNELAREKAETIKVRAELNAAREAVNAEHAHVAELRRALLKQFGGGGGRDAEEAAWKTTEGHFGGPGGGAGRGAGGGSVGGMGMVGGNHPGGGLSMPRVEETGMELA